MPAVPNVGQIISTTLFDQSGEIQDAILNNNAFSALLKLKDRIELSPGGYEIRKTIRYQDNGTVKFYEGLEEFDTTDYDVVTVARHQWKQLGGSVIMSGKEMRMNNGDKAIFKLIAEKLTALKDSMSNVHETALHGDGSTFSGKAWTGLDAALTTNPLTGTYGAIARADWEFWRHLYRSSLTDYGVARDASNIKDHLKKAMNAVRVQNRGIDALLMGDDDFSDLETAAESILRVNNPANQKLIELGYDTFKYKGADVVNCGGSGGAITTRKILGLRLETWSLDMHEDCNFVPLDPERVPTKQDGVVKLMGAMGQLCGSNMKFNFHLGA